MFSVKKKLLERSIEMALKDILMEDLKMAMRNKDKSTKGTLQLVKAALEKAEKEKKDALTEQEEIAIVQREIKQMDEFLLEAKNAGRTGLVEVGEQKLELLSKYVPKQLTEQEVKQLLTEKGIHKGMNMGEAMKASMQVLNGKASNKVISKVVREII